MVQSAKEKKTKIMVVDDTPAYLKPLIQMLEDNDYIVIVFSESKKALRSSAANPPDLILTDINMPELDGFELCRLLKSNPVTKEIPVIFISSLMETKEKVRAFNLGAVDYLTKPVQLDEAKARIETHLDLRRLQLELDQKNRHLESLVDEKVKEISNSQIATITALAKLAEYKDDTTGEHIERTQTYCFFLVSELQKFHKYKKIIDENFIENLTRTAPLHDIGKVAIPDNILQKPGKLTPEEFEIMKTHTTLGAETLQEVYQEYPKNEFIKMGIEIARSHHEKWDGSGYPDGLVGEAIPLCARIMGLADAYDAMRSERPYKPAFSHEKTAQIIYEDSGTHFDPMVVKAFKAHEKGFEEISAGIVAE